MSFIYVMAKLKFQIEFQFDPSESILMWFLPFIQDSLMNTVQKNSIYLKEKSCVTL